MQGRKKMPKYIGYLKHSQYFKIEVEADSWGDARDLMWEHEPNWSKPCDMDNDIVDIEEIA
jgi:hypothetical protein